LCLDDRHELAAEHQEKKEANDADEEKVDNERRGLEAARLHDIVRRAVQEGDEGTACPKQRVSRHQDGEDVDDGPLTGLTEEFDGNETAGEEENERDNEDAGSYQVTNGAEVRQQNKRDSDRDPEKAGRPRTAKEEQDPAIEQDKRGEDEEVLYDDRDEVRDAASYDRQDATEEAGEKAESKESRPGQMAVHPPHAQKGDDVHQRQQSLTGEERSIIHPREPHNLVRSTGAGAKKVK
jgi:hypothetical protein